MQQKRKVAYRHVRQTHYHHRIPVTSKNFRPRFNHKQFIAAEMIIKKNQCSSDGTSQSHFAVSDKSNGTEKTAKKKGLFGLKKKKSSKDNAKGGTKKKKKHGKHYALKKFLAKLVIVALIFWAVYKYVFVVMILYGNYMFPAVRDGDLLIAYKLQEPIINNVVIYNHNGEQLVGRIVAKENAVIRYNSETETYSVNGITPTESIFYTTVENPDADIEYPYTVPAGCVYILVDHREDFKDSRTYEAIPTSEIQGVVVFVIRRRGF